MRHPRFIASLLCCAVSTACLDASEPYGELRAGGERGALELTMDLVSLQAVSITSVAVSVSRTGHATVQRTLTVANGVATGVVSALAPGYWHVAVEVYDGASRIYTGAADVNVIAGVTVQCQILFDPVVTPPDTGSISITVGMNPMPGWTALDQTVTEVLLDGANRKLYVHDGAANVIGVYDADTLVRVKDLVLPGAPTAVALNAAGTGIFLGYASGHVRLLDVATGGNTLVADVLMSVARLAALDAPFLMVVGAGSYSSASLKVIDAGTGQVVSTRAPWYSLAEPVYNPAAKTVYAHHLGVSPTDIHYIKVDAAGAMTADGDSIYHGDYGFGRPLRVIKNGARLATSSGAMFTSAELVANDLRFAGSLGYAYVDLSADDGAGKLYLLNSSGIPKLVVIDDETYFVELTVDLSGNPVRVLHTESSIVVLSTKDARTYAKVFAKADLGL
jgi:hypothetical protein